LSNAILYEPIWVNFTIKNSVAHTLICQIIGINGNDKMKTLFEGWLNTSRKKLHNTSESK